MTYRGTHGLPCRMDMGSGMGSMMDGAEPAVVAGGMDNSTAFCNEMMSMSMLMDGFGVSWGETMGCCIFLFQNYELNSAGLLVSAYVITLALGMVVHVIGFSRLRLTRSTGDADYCKRVVGSLLYTLQVGVGYLLMLIAMTYRADLFVCALLGLFIGHVTFHSKICFKTQAVRPGSPLLARTALTAQDPSALEAGTKYAASGSGHRQHQLQQPAAIDVAHTNVEEADPCCAHLEADMQTPRAQR